MRRAVFLAGMGLAILPGGCGKSDEGIDGKRITDRPAARGTRAPASRAADRGPGKTLPQSFPLATYPGSFVENVDHNPIPKGPVLFQVYLRVSASIADVAAFYEKEMNAKGLTVRKAESFANQSGQVVLQGKSDKLGADVVIAGPDPDGDVSVTIGCSIKPAATDSSGPARDASHPHEHGDPSTTAPGRP